jgi:hypothetical protein
MDVPGGARIVQPSDPQGSFFALHQQPAQSLLRELLAVPLVRVVPSIRRSDTIILMGVCAAAAGICLLATRNGGPSLTGPERAVACGPGGRS